MVSLLVLTGVLISCSGVKNKVTPEEARSIAKEAYIYGFPMVDGYRIIYAYFIDSNNPEFKAPFNQIRNIARVFTPEDKAVQTPNSDTPYSMLGMDLRTEPIVITVPQIDKNRYFSIQLVDCYTFNFGYFGSRTTGNDGGNFMVAGPGWNGETPAGINKVIRSETEFALAAFRTQLFNPADLDNVKKIQDGYKVQTLSAFLGKPVPSPAPKIEFLKPISVDDQKTSLAFFDELNFWLQFCPANPAEKELMARFAKIGIGPGQKFDPEKFSPEVKQAIAEGMKDAWKDLKDFQETSIMTGKVTSGQLFGTREFLNNNYLYRYTAAVLGIFGNSKQEAMYPIYKTDASGQILDGSKNRYTLHFRADQLPPVNAFWSVTMYELPKSLLVANPINRYLINSPMLPTIKRDNDGGITLYVQRESPGKLKENNWLPAPKGPFMAVMRLYWPKDEAINGTWKEPPMELVK
ncbi:MAG: DUF1254 domain-containing protein [Bacteroidota bacterium]